MHIFKTTHKQYKDILVQWFKGTGGGSGLATEFETWDSAKYEKYDIEEGTYDHTDVAARPAILFNMYSSNRHPYLTVIHMWDQLSDGLLSSKHNPLRIGRGEPGISPTSCSTLTSASSSNQTGNKRKVLDESAQSVTECMKTFIDMCSSNSTSKDTKSKKLCKVDDMNVEQLYKLMDQQKNHLTFMTEIGSLSDKEKQESITQIKKLNVLIMDKTGLSIDKSSNNVSN